MGNKIKKTVIWKGLFGEKHVKTKWIERPGWGSTIFVAIILYLLVRGCG